MSVKELIMLLLAEVANGKEDNSVFIRIRDDEFPDGYYDLFVNGLVHDDANMGICFVTK